MNEEEYFDYLKLCAEITDKLDNTAEYESWLLVQDYADYEHRELIRLNNIIKEVRKIVRHEKENLDKFKGVNLVINTYQQVFGVMLSILEKENK